MCVTGVAGREGQGTPRCATLHWTLAPTPPLTHAGATAVRLSIAFLPPFPQGLSGGMLRSSVCAPHSFSLVLPLPPSLPLPPFCVVSDQYLYKYLRCKYSLSTMTLGCFL